MEPHAYLWAHAVAGLALCAGAGLTATHLRVQGIALAQRAAQQQHDLPPLVAIYFRWMARGLAAGAGLFLALAVADGLVSRAGAQGLAPRALGFSQAGLLLATGGLLLMAGTVDLRLRLAARWHRGLMLGCGVAGITLAAACMLQLVRHGRLWPLGY